MSVLRTLEDAVRFFNETLAEHPQRDALVTEEAWWKGEHPRRLAMYVAHRIDPADTTHAAPFFTIPESCFADDARGRLAGRILALLEPLDLLNPVSRCVGLDGAGSPADLIPAFGVPKSEDGGAPARILTLDEVLRMPPPDPWTSGLMPTFRQSAGQLRDLLPPGFRIAMPDLQGPFNLLHALVGNDAFTAPYEEPAKFRQLMERITTFWIAAYENLMTWIGSDRLRVTEQFPRLAECSVNMVSEEFYREHILPHDRRIAARFGGVRIHPCSGLHVFRVTLAELPVVMTEAGWMIAQMAAPVVSVAEALRLIGSRPIRLAIGQELPADRNEALRVVREDIAAALRNPHVLPGGYTGIYWRKKDRPMIRELHLELDRHWEACVR